MSSHRYVRAGIMLIELEPEGKEQLSLIETRNVKAEKLMKVIDEINATGKAKLLFGSQGIGDRDWHMKRQFLSPHYLTRWEDLPVVS